MKWIALMEQVGKVGGYLYGGGELERWIGKQL